MLAIQCWSRRDTFWAAMVHGISEMIDALILLAWRVVFRTIDRYTSFHCIEKNDPSKTPNWPWDSGIDGSIQMQFGPESKHGKKDSPYFWLSRLGRKYAVIFDRFCATAHGATYYKNWLHMWSHSYKAVKNTISRKIGQVCFIGFLLGMAEPTEGNAMRRFTSSILRNTRPYWMITE